MSHMAALILKANVGLNAAASSCENDIKNRIDSSWMSADERNVSIKTKWDNPILHDEVRSILLLNYFISIYYSANYFILLEKIDCYWSICLYLFKFDWCAITKFIIPTKTNCFEIISRLGRLAIPYGDKQMNNVLLWSALWLLNINLFLGGILKRCQVSISTVIHFVVVVCHHGYYSIIY